MFANTDFFLVGQFVLLTANSATSQSVTLTSVRTNAVLKKNPKTSTSYIDALDTFD